jgi:hypothetical protein
MARLAGRGTLVVASEATISNEGGKETQCCAMVKLSTQLMYTHHEDCARRDYSGFQLGHSWKARGLCAARKHGAGVSSCNGLKLVSFGIYVIATLKAPDVGEEGLRMRF